MSATLQMSKRSRYGALREEEVHWDGATMGSVKEALRLVGMAKVRIRVQVSALETGTTQA